VARDLAAAGHGRLKPWSVEPVSGRFASPITWANEFRAACPWVIGRTVRGVKNGSSPKWLADRLIAIGLRPINALADITNYFCFDLGRPLHVFDVGRIAGGKLTLRPGAGESFRALNGKDYVADVEDCVIADGSGVVSLAGVMGGASTGCDETTTEVFIECALFDPVRVALSGRRHEIVSDARQRFERGVDPSFLPDALEAATRMVMELCGGEPSSTTVAGGEPPWQREASLRFARLASFGGAEIAPDEAVRRLERLGFTVERRSVERVDVSVPPWRNDIAAGGLHRGAGRDGSGLDQAPELDPARAATAAEGALEIEPEADLVEEVLRLSGLDAIPAVSLPVARVVPEATLSAKQVRTALARRTLAAGGLLEAVGLSFVARGQELLFGEASDSLRLVNPIAEDLDQLRSTPMVSLALTAQRNQARGLTLSALFEIGPGFDEAGQNLIAAALRAGITAPNWAERSRAPDAFDAKGDVMAVLAALGVPIESLSVSGDAPGFYHPGRSGVVRQGPKLVLARFGELHPRVRAALGLDQVAVAAEVFLDAIPEPKKRRKAAPEISALQPVRRDFAFVVGEDVAAETLLRAARGAERGMIAGVSLFDVYPGLPGGKKSLAIEVVLQPRDRSLTDAEIEAVSAKVVNAVVKATGGSLR
jgi:phenylalanyl-tRNA synthetase beta chain